jgi:hypothetical protein
MGLLPWFGIPANGHDPGGNNNLTHTRPSQEYDIGGVFSDKFLAKPFLGKVPRKAPQEGACDRNE